MANLENGSSGFYNFSEEQNPLEYGYHLEGQAIAVHQAQIAGRLKESSFTFSKLTTRVEMGTEWYVLNYGIKIFAGDCKEEVINLLKPGETVIEEVVGDECRPDIFEGKEETPVAALFVDGQILYRSPGFNLEIYQAPPKNSDIDSVSPHVERASRLPNSSSENKWRKMTRSERRKLYRAAIDSH